MLFVIPSIGGAPCRNIDAIGAVLPVGRSLDERNRIAVRRHPAAPASGVVLAGFYLLPMYGLTGAAIIAAAFSVGAAAVAFWTPSVAGFQCAFVRGWGGSSQLRCGWIVRCMRPRRTHCLDAIAHAYPWQHSLYGIHHPFCFPDGTCHRRRHRIFYCGQNKEAPHSVWRLPDWPHCGDCLDCIYDRRLSFLLADRSAVVAEYPIQFSDRCAAHILDDPAGHIAVGQPACHSHLLRQGTWCGKLTRPSWRRRRRCDCVQRRTDSFDGNTIFRAIADWSVRRRGFRVLPDVQAEGCSSRACDGSVLECSRNVMADFRVRPPHGNHIAIDGAQHAKRRSAPCAVSR